MASGWAWLFRFIHIMSGVIWLGGAALWSMLITPRILRTGPPAIRRPFLEATLMPITRLMMVSGALTIVSGFFVMGILAPSGDIIGMFQNGTYGLALGIGLVGAVVMYAEGMLIIRPTAHRLLEEMQKMPAPTPGAPPAPPPEIIMKLGKKVGIAGMTSLLFGFIALAGMTWAVNLVR